MENLIIAEAKNANAYTSLKKLKLFLRGSFKGLIRSCDVKKINMELLASDKKVGLIIHKVFNEALNNLYYKFKLLNKKNDLADTEKNKKITITKIEILTGKGKCLKRMIPRSRGMANPKILHRAVVKLFITAEISKGGNI